MDETTSGCSKSNRARIAANDAKLRCHGFAAGSGIASRRYLAGRGHDRRRRLDDILAILAPDRLRRHRNHLFRAVASHRGDLDAGDLHLTAAGADQDRSARIAVGAPAGVQQQTAGADLVPQFAIAVGGHGEGAILRIAHQHGLGPARRRLAAKPQRLDLRRQAFGHGQHRPVGLGGLVIAQRVEARANLVARDPRVSGIAAGPIAHQEVQRPGRNEPPGAGVEQAMRRGQDLVARNHHAAAGGAGLVVQLADRGPRIAQLIDGFAMLVQWSDGRAAIGAVCSGQHQDAGCRKAQQHA